ncbi:unnamed protein product [Microthlaspi erraticum]|uniref:Germin-like protein n=1 Tax=Microthlaspi erraticum TaxID=1685480 RepID=A0A6D2L6H4_9BRAS|nr:unnamed protein product [Microthlaspi erraticum]
MSMKSISFLASLSLFALTFQFAIAADPSQLQDFCVATNSPVNGVYVNGEFCKDPAHVTADDFFFPGLNVRKSTNNQIGSTVTFGYVNNVPGLNTLGLSFARADIGVNGQVKPHIHPRASEIFGVAEGTILAGFISSDQRFFTKILHVGDVMVFPQGLIHITANVGNVPAVAFVGLNSQDPGVIFVAENVFGSNPPINATILAKAFQLNVTTVMELQAKF